MENEIVQKVGSQGETVGRTIHYVNLGDKDGKYPPQIVASIITAINDDGTVAIKCLYPTGMFDCPSIPFSEHYKRGHWSWPPRLPLSEKDTAKIVEAARQIVGVP